MHLRVVGLYCWPVKSCAGIELQAAQLDRYGISGDRQFMVVDEKGNFLTQRDCPQLALIQASYSGWGGALELSHNEKGRFTLSQTRDYWTMDKPRRVRIFENWYESTDQGNSAAQWLTKCLGREVRLVRVPPNHNRIPNRRPEGVETLTAFSDGYPLLLTSTASLAELNARLPPGTPEMSMLRFRSNIVVEGFDRPRQEFELRQFQLGHANMFGVKPCPRCPVTQVDPKTGIRPEGAKEPLTTLAQLSKESGIKGGACFGMNIIHARGYPYTIRLNDQLQNPVFGDIPAL